MVTVPKEDWVTERNGMTAAPWRHAVLWMSVVMLGLGLAQAQTSQGPEPGTGRLQAGGELYVFRLIACELETRNQSSGDTLDLWLLGEGCHQGEDFFIEVERGRRGGEVRTSLRLYKTALPEGWNHGRSVGSDSHAEERLRVQSSDGMEEVDSRVFHLEKVVLNDTHVRVVGSVRLLRLRLGHADAFVGPGTLDVSCFR